MADGGLGGQGDLKAEMEALSEGIAKARAQADAQAAIESGGILKSIKRMWDSFMHPRHPKGSPDGGKFSGKQGGLFDGEDGGPKPGVKWYDDSDHLFSKYEGIGAKDAPGAYAQQPKPRPKSAVTHPAVNDKGDAVWIDHPSKPSPPEVWDDPKAAISFTPNSAAPDSLNGIPFAPWADAPTTPEGWLNVPGQNPIAEMGWPKLEAPKGKSVGAGVIIEEPDGRIWIVSPTNGFGGYRSTFPKGTYEDDIASLQANAIKEAYEESGLQVEITGVLGDFKRTTSVARFYMARRVGGTPSAMGWESQAARLIPLDELPKWLNRKEVDHPIVEAIEEHFKERIYKSMESIAKAFDETKVQRWPKGSPLGGQFKDSGADGVAKPPKIGWKKDGSGPGANAVYYNKMLAAYNAASWGDLEPAKALWKANHEYAKQFTDGVKMNSHGKWKAQTAQYAFELISDDIKAKQTITLASTIDAKLGAPKISGWTKVGAKPGGTAPGGLYTDETGQKWLVKGNLQGKDDNRAKNEVLASKLMAAAGVPAPEYKLVDLGGEYGGGMGVAVKWEEGLTKVGTNPSGLTKKKAYDQFAVHAWLGNWDVVGAEGDNLMRRADGSMVNIDPGGALLYRAQGMAKKPGEFDSTPGDWDTMRKTGNSAAIVFGGMTAEDLQNSAIKLQGIDNATIEALVKAHGPGNASEQNGLVDTLIARRDALLALNHIDAPLTVGVPDPVPAPKVEPAPAPPKPSKAAEKQANDLLAAEYAHTKVAQAFGSNITAPAYAYVTIVAGADALGEPDKGFVPQLQNALDGQIKYAASNSELKVSTKLKGLQAAAGMAAIIHYHQTGKVDVEMVAEMEAELAKSVFGSEEAYTAALEADLDADPVTPPKVRWPTEPTGIKSDTIMGGDVAMIKQMLGKGGSGVTPGYAKSIKSGLYGNSVFASSEKGPEVEQYAKDMLAAWEADKGIAPAPEPAKPNLSQAMINSNKKAQADAAAYKSSMAPAIPDFEAAKLADTNSNAPSHNAKVDVIAALTAKEDVKGLLSLNYGTNTYGKKQAALANNALAALGSDEVVTPGQKTGSHPAVAGLKPAEAAVTAATVAKAAKPVQIKPSDLPKKPDFANFKGEGKGLSSKAWKNAQNQALVDTIETKALTGDLVGLQNLTYDQINDNEAGEKTGKVLPFAEHPSNHVQKYWSESFDAVHSKLHPPKPMVPAKTLKSASLDKVASHFAPVELLVPATTLPDNMQMGFWAALGVTEAPAGAFVPKGVGVATTAEKQAMVAGYHKSSDLSKAFMRSVQATGSTNDAFRMGKLHYPNHSQFMAGHSQLSTVDTAVAAKKDAVELREGTEFYKWINFPENMQKQLQAALPGTVIQNPGSMCTSTSGMGTKGFGAHRVVLRAAKGAKVLPSFGSGAFENEAELTTLPGARMVLTKVTKIQGRLEVEMTLLPPHVNDHLPVKSKSVLYKAGKG